MVTDLTQPVQQHNLIPSAEEREFFRGIPDDTFLPSLKLLQGVNPELKDAKLQAGMFFLSVRNKAVGNKVLIRVCERRAHALLLINSKKTKESFNFKSPIFQEIINTKSTSDQSIRSAWSQTDFLVWLPEEQEFASFFPGQKTLRPVGMEIVDYMTPGVKDIKTNCFELFATFDSHGPTRRSWVPKIIPLDSDRQDMIPEILAFKAAHAIFMSPVSNEVKIGVATDSDER